MIATEFQAIFDGDSSSSNDSQVPLHEQNIPDETNMLYLLASVAHDVSLDRLNVLATAAEFLCDEAQVDKREIPSSNPVNTRGLPTQQSEKRIFRECCVFCSRSFSCKEYLRRHLRRHVVIKGGQPNEIIISPMFPDLGNEIQCIDDPSDQCEKNTSGSPRNPNDFWCEKCERNFQREATYRVHMRFHARKRSVSSRPVTCKKCNALCMTRTQYLIHKKMHRLQKLFSKQNHLSKWL